MKVDLKHGRWLVREITKRILGFKFQKTGYFKRGDSINKPHV